MQRCGLVVLERAVQEHAVVAFREGLETLLAPHLSSRARLRQTLKQGATQGRTLESLWADPLLNLSQQAVLQHGHNIRERNDGRIDVLLPWQAPFNNTAFSLNPLIMPVLEALLGKLVRLKQVNAVVALQQTDMAHGTQHWHRDTGLLFEDDEAFHDKNVHDRTHGLHLPPYAVDMFVPLTQWTADNGPTEFTLGSHQWGQNWSEDEQADPPPVDRRFYLPPGSAVLMDYRTVHRGTCNQQDASRPMAMLVYGRDWWTDAVNYGAVDYGGMGLEGFWRLDRRPDMQRQLSVHQQINADHSLCDRRLQAKNGQVPEATKQQYFRYLSTLWQKSLLRELRATASYRQQKDASDLL